MIYKKLYGTVKINKKLSCVGYMHNNQWYVLPIISKKGPKQYIEKSFDEENRDITELITNLSGPNCDFHLSNITPYHLDLKKIVIIVDGEEKIFNENDIINL